MPNSEFMTPEEAAEVLAISKETVRRMVRSGNLKGIQIGRQYRVLRAAVEEIVAKARGDD